MVSENYRFNRFPVTTNEQLIGVGAENSKELLDDIELAGFRGNGGLEILAQEVILGQKVQQASFHLDSPDRAFLPTRIESKK